MPKTKLSERVSPTPTAYKIYCPDDGSIYLTQKEYDRQMSFDNASVGWTCPVCGRHDCGWDDNNFERVMGIV
jgi:predicted RNA-binding Zn-ribbon protein involved in translation (DUF1610 family)